MTTNAGRGAAHEPPEGGGGSEGLGYNLPAIAAACEAFLEVWRDPDAVSPAFGRPVRMLIDALAERSEPKSSPMPHELGEWPEAADFPGNGHGWVETTVLTDSRRHFMCTSPGCDASKVEPFFPLPGDQPSGDLR